MSVKCDYCHRDAELVTGTAIYPHRQDLLHKQFWKCAPCGAWVGCHDNDKRKNGFKPDAPMGRLANAELRRAKMQAHAAFDPIWKSRRMSRKEAYRWLAKQIGISESNCHIGMLDVDGCKAIIAACKLNDQAPQGEKP